jgi:dTDP-4-amino-4,6-dideoxygalactose transaminase
MENQIPLVDLRAQYEPLKTQIRQSWEEVLDSMHLFLGPNVQAFEHEFANYCGVSDGVGVGDGTTALQLALRAAGIGPGDEVITVSNTFIATIEAIVSCGAVPVFVDVTPDTLLMDVSKIESLLTPRTRAVLPVHLYGQCADMDPILEIARRENLIVIEDACQAHGATYKGRRAGSMGHLAAFSFYFSKNLGAYGEGGMVTTSHPELARQVRLLRNHGSEIRYYHEQLGFNARLDELQAAALRIKLKHLDGWNERRRQVAEFYTQALSDMDLDMPFEAPEGCHVYHLFVVKTKQRDALSQYLNRNGIGTGVHYPVPIHLQKASTSFGLGPGSLPVTEEAAEQILSLPMYPELSEAQLERVVSEIRSFFYEKEAV